MALEVIHKITFYATYPLLLITAFLAMQITLHFLEAKAKWWQRVFLYVVHFIMSTTLVFVGVGDYLPPLLVLVSFVTGLCLLCRGRLLARFSMGMILVMLPLSFNAVLTSLRPPFDRFIFVFMALFWLVILLFVRKALPNGEKPPIRSRRLWGLIDLLTLMPFGTVFSLIAFTSPEYLHISPDPFTDTLYIRHEQMLIFILCLSVVAALALFSAVVVLSRHEQLEHEKTLWQMRNQYYQNMEETQQQVRRLRHDMANHLTTLIGLDSQGMRQYVETLIDSPAIQEGGRYCENQVVNAVLSAKIPVMEEDRIRYELHVSLPREISLSEIDLCSLFANSLDNAIEANRSLPEGDRQIELHAALHKGVFVLKLINTTSGTLHMEDGKIATSKKDKTLHGFGLDGMREIAQRYQGTLDSNVKAGKFQLTVVIPARLV